jgi:HD superfamily phosphohydrolase
LAGVLHDVGHGPFSHLFDNKVVKKANGKDWEHEIASLSLIEDMYKYVLNNSNKS